MKSKLLFSALFVAFLGFANISMAQDGSFAKNHPRRAEVNQRLNNQDHRINRKVKNGDISRREAHNLHRNVIIRSVMKKEEWHPRHGGHLTKHEQYRLNRQENHMSRRIQKA